MRRQRDDPDDARAEEDPPAAGTRISPHAWCFRPWALSNVRLSMSLVEPRPASFLANVGKRSRLRLAGYSKPRARSASRSAFPSKPRKSWNTRSQKASTRLSSRVAATGSPFRRSGLAASSTPGNSYSHRREYSGDLRARVPRSHDNSTRHGYLEMVAGGQTLGTRHAVSVAETIDAYPADSRRACDIAPSLPPYPVDRAPHRNLRDPRSAGDLLALLASRARRAAGPDHSSLREWPALDGRATPRRDLRVAPGAELGSPRADSAASRRRRARGRGPAVLDSSGDRSARRGAGLSRQSQAGRAPRGRQHHHPAAGADPVPRHPTHVGTKGSGGPHRPSPRSPVFQAAHPRGLSQFRLSRSRRRPARLRPSRRRAPFSRQGRGRPRRRRGGLAGERDPRPEPGALRSRQEVPGRHHPRHAGGTADRAGGRPAGCRPAIAAAIDRGLPGRP